MSKPDFALTLSFEGIGLLLRNDAAWNRVGDVPLDVSDLTGALELLRKTASEFADGPLHAKLILPNEQIKYLRISDPGGGREVQEAAVKAALDGATPYELGELSFDWAERNGELTIAAVAHETLEEAETFACENGFEPVYFAAAPEAGTFEGEPYFGETKFARARGLDSIERDTQAIVVDGVARPPEPERLDAAEVAAGRAPEDGQATGTPDGSEQDTAAGPDDETRLGAESSSVEATPNFSRDNEVEAPAPLTFASRRPQEQPGEAPPLAGVTRRKPVPPTAPIEIEPASSQKDYSTDSDTSGMTLDSPQVPSEDTLAMPEEDTDPLMERAAESLRESKIETEAPQGGAFSFFSRRSSEIRASERPALRIPGLHSQTPATASAPPPNVIPPAASEKERLTIFGARKPESSDGGATTQNKPRFLGLVLTAVLLLFLIGVGAWASIFVDDGLSRFFGSDDTRAVKLPEETRDELEIEGEEAMVPEPDARVATLGAGPDPVDEADARPEPAQPTAMTLEDVKAKYAVTGIWTRAPAPPPAPALQPDDDFYIPSIDSSIATEDAFALPDLASFPPDDGLNRQSNPAAYGQTFNFDERGLVVATEDGTLAPEGHMVFAGKPAAVPPDLPDRALETSGDEAARFERLSQVRPKARPSGLIEANERATLGGLSRAELAAMRPKMRPPSAEAIAAAVRRQEEETQDTVPRTPGAVAIALPDSESDTPDLDPDATPQAVATSVKPRHRPSDIERIVKRAESQEQDLRNVAASATVAPRIPSQASVAKQATERNAINLRRVNLIGVYGKSSNRRALVRLSSGRYKKVKVGDRIDGGRVSAIGDGELRYQKNGRNVTLKMPRG